MSMFGVTPAGFILRFLAVVLDCLLFFLFVTVPVALVSGTISLAGSDNPIWMNIGLGYLLPFIITLWFWQKYLGTPGKLMMGIQIVDMRTGRKPSVFKSTLRYFAYLVSIAPFFLGFIWIAFDKNKRGFHDYISGTAVIKRVPEYIKR
ncbi:RDD family protein [Salinimonas marina]|uniref:RDD family protein n=1 Tax=Salinimonas marina TaxID=2785918 RepID=A0A7S9DWR8_9ALTE|nr:RDD family protein [Salinimonas marina]QPG04675.1 RDD family protein [Salinimonas marina]